MHSAALLVWVLYLVTPGDMPNIPVAGPTLTLQECHAQEAEQAAPFPFMCMPQWLAWDDLT